jgi:excisionase family DNA binding protein
MNDILTTDEVADLLQCDVVTVENKLRQGELPGIKPGRSWMCPRVALLEVLNQQAHQNITARPSRQPINSPTPVQRGRRRSPIPQL